MLNNKKYILQKTAKFACCSILALTIINQTSNLFVRSVPYTKEDMKFNKVYTQELKTIAVTKPEFKNLDLINELINQGIDIKHPNRVSSISITNSLINNDFSDLKYFPNLTSLHIENNDIDISDIKYNYNLLSLSTKNTTVSNTKYLPNSIYSLELHDTIVEDSSLEVPYNTKYLAITNTPFSNLYLKNPTQLNRLFIVGNAFLNLDSLKECSNLSTITLHRIANVQNSNILADLNAKSLSVIDLDDYAPIWLTKETYLNLGLENEQILLEIEALDQLASSLVNKNDTDEQKIKSIATHILSSLTYDSEINKKQLTDYNDNPINYGLNKGKGICINYASLFTALANRVGIDTYQIYNNDHTWNMIQNDDTSFIDLTMLDAQTIVEVLTEYGKEYYEKEKSSLEYINSNEEDSLYHYHITLEELLKDEHLSTYSALPKEDTEQNHNIGYVKQNGLTIDFNNRAYYVEYSKISALASTITMLIIFAYMLRKEKNKEHTLELF